MEGEIELYNISFLILKVELHFNMKEDVTINTGLEKCPGFWCLTYSCSEKGLGGRI